MHMTVARRAAGVSRLILLSGLFLAGAALQAQAPVTPAAAGPQAVASRSQTQLGNEGGKTYTNKLQFRLPFDLSDSEASGLREVMLYAKYGAESWTWKETAAPTQKHFTFQAAQDGEYWFSVATVNKAGQVVPADVSKEPPNLIGVRVLEQR